MIKFLIALIVLGCIAFCIRFILHKKMKVKEKKKYYKTPKLSNLKGEDFKKYIDNITKDL